jgi:hypothetical protein
MRQITLNGPALDPAADIGVTPASMTERQAFDLLSAGSGRAATDGCWSR